MGYVTNLASVMIVAAGVGAGLYNGQPDRATSCNVPDDADLAKLSAQYTAFARQTNYQNRSLASGYFPIQEKSKEDPDSLRMSVNHVLHSNYNMLDNLSKVPVEGRMMQERIKEIERAFSCK